MIHCSILLNNCQLQFSTLRRSKNWDWQSNRIKKQRKIQKLLNSTSPVNSFPSFPKSHNAVSVDHSPFKARSEWWRTLRFSQITWLSHLGHWSCPLFLPQNSFVKHQRQDRKASAMSALLLVVFARFDAVFRKDEFPSRSELLLELYLLS